MPVYGGISRTALKATIHNCGLLRSSDGGNTWGDFSWIAQGQRPIIGAAPSSRFSFQGLSVQPLPDGRWLAMITARRLNKAGDGPTEVNEGPGAPQVLCRLWSSDEGRTWTEPNQLMPGAWPSLAIIGQHTLCASTLWSAWSVQRLIVSRDCFETFYQEAGISKRGWTRGMTNRPQETPLPPTVPYLAKEWPYEHYGYLSVLPLAHDNLIVAFGESQRGNVYVDGRDSESLNIPWDKERIRAVFFRRKAYEDELTSPLVTRPPAPRGRWVLAERIIVEDVGALAQIPNGELIGQVAGRIRRSSDGGRTWEEVKEAKLPDDGSPSAFGVLNSGRWLTASVQWNKPDEYDPPIKMGMCGGYPVFKETGSVRDCSVVVSYSDDQGKNWKSGQPFLGPFKWALPTVSRFLETPDGTVALPIYGCVTAEEASSGSCSNGIIRSSDGGETWGDFSFVFRTNPKGPGDIQSEPRYTEMDIVPLPNGHWVACSRSEYILMGPKGLDANDVVVSTDFGRTWKRTGGTLAGVSQQKGILLPDGSIAFTYRCHSWQGPGVAISCDEGRSFYYALAGPYETINAFALGTKRRKTKSPFSVWCTPKRKTKVVEPNQTGEKAKAKPKDGSEGEALYGQDEFLVFTAKSHRSDMSAGVYRWVPYYDERP